MQATVRLRVEHFDLMTRVLGCESDVARGQLINVNPKTVARARQGRVGEVFMAQAVAGLQRHGDALRRYGLVPTLDSLFEVVPAEVQ